MKDEVKMAASPSLTPSLLPQLLSILIKTPSHHHDETELFAYRSSLTFMKLSLFLFPWQTVCRAKLYVFSITK